VNTQSFGGAWTEDKLDRLRRYLVEYTKIFHRGEQARRYKTIYVDAFAGTGYRTRRRKSSVGLDLFPEQADDDAADFLEGSATLALKLEQGFDRYVFIELDLDNVQKLDRLRLDYADRVVEIQQGDANAKLVELCKETDWNSHRSVVFLDPFAMETDWQTIECIGATHAVDLWLLFPLSAVNRLLTRKGSPPDSWAAHLTRLFGTDEWRGVFYPETECETLFGREITQLKQADFHSIGDFFVKRLSTAFYHVAPEPRALVSSRNVPLFLLCFAAGNPGKGGEIALRIASHILKM